MQFYPVKYEQLFLNPHSREQGSSARASPFTRPLCRFLTLWLLTLGGGGRGASVSSDENENKNGTGSQGRSEDQMNYSCKVPAPACSVSSYMPRSHALSPVVSEFLWITSPGGAGPVTYGSRGVDRDCGRLLGNLPSSAPRAGELATGPTQDPAADFYRKQAVQKGVREDPEIEATVFL